MLISRYNLNFLFQGERIPTGEMSLLKTLDYDGKVSSEHFDTLENELIKVRKIKNIKRIKSVRVLTSPNSHSASEIVCVKLLYLYRFYNIIFEGNSGGKVMNSKGTIRYKNYLIVYPRYKILAPNISGEPFERVEAERFNDIIYKSKFRDQQKLIK